MLKYSRIRCLFLTIIVGLSILVSICLGINGQINFKSILTLVLMSVLIEIFLVVRLIMYNKEYKLYKERESDLLNKGYKKIHDNLFVDENNKRINILGTDYGFNQIVYCDLIRNIIPKKDPNGFDECNELYVNITTDNLQNPNIKYNVMTRPYLKVPSVEFDNSIRDAKNIISYLNIIISRNKEVIFDNGNVTKIEHRYINEPTANDKLRELYKLYQDGIITEYEYNIEKQQILDKEN